MEYQAKRIGLVILITSCCLQLYFTVDRAFAESNADCSLQVQNSVSLTAGRYISILKAFQSGPFDQSVDNMDWWIDQAILELMFLEETYPDKKLEENFVPGSDGILQYKKLYQGIAQYRLNNIRRHKVPLDDKLLKIIDDFVKKYGKS